MKIFSWFRSWFVAARVTREIADFKRRLNTLDRRRKAVSRRITKRERHFLSIAKAWDVEKLEMQRELNEAKNTERSYEEEIERLRSSLQVCEDITIPALTASHRLILERLDADLAVEVRRKIQHVEVRE